MDGANLQQDDIEAVFEPWTERRNLSRLHGNFHL